jgi:hypothetical protein
LEVPSKQLFSAGTGFVGGVKGEFKGKGVGVMLEKATGLNRSGKEKNGSLGWGSVVPLPAHCGGIPGEEYEVSVPCISGKMTPDRAYSDMLHQTEKDVRIKHSKQLSKAINF